MSSSTYILLSVNIRFCSVTPYSLKGIYQTAVIIELGHRTVRKLAFKQCVMSATEKALLYSSRTEVNGCVSPRRKYPLASLSGHFLKAISTYVVKPTQSKKEIRIYSLPFSYTYPSPLTDP